MQNFPNLQVALHTLAENEGDREFIRVPTQSTHSYVTYKIGTFYRRVGRLAAAFSSELGMRSGDRVAVLINDPEDLALIAHALWLNRQVLIPMMGQVDDEFILRVFDNCNVRTVIFPPEQAARVVNIISKAKSVERWLVSGNAGGIPETPGIKRLDRIMYGSIGGGDAELAISDSDTLGLICFSKDKTGALHGMAFTQGELVHAALGAVELFKGVPAGETTWSLLPIESIVGLVQSLITPLFSKIPSLLLFNPDIRFLWEYAARAKVSTIFVADTQLVEITRRARRAVSLAEVHDQRVVMLLARAITGEELSNLSKALLGRLLPAYACAEAGGLITVMPGDLTIEERKEWSEKSPSSLGVVLPGITLEVVDRSKTALSPGQDGAIRVRSKQCMSSYMGSDPGELVFDRESFLYTGQRGSITIDSNGRRHLILVD